MKPLRRHRYSHRYQRATFKKVWKEEEKAGKMVSDKETLKRVSELLYGCKK